jgi:hypothetical protein
MKLYADDKAKSGVWCDDRIVKVKVGLKPPGIVVQLSVVFCISFMLVVIFLFLTLRLGFGYMSGLDRGSGCLEFLLLDVFFICGMALSSWCAIYLMMVILPFSSEINIDAKTMSYGNVLLWRKCQLGDEVLLLVEPCYNRGDWGFSMKIISEGRKCLLLPGMFVGSYANAISQARNIATNIKKCAPFVRVIESKYWRVH